MARKTKTDQYLTAFFAEKSIPFTGWTLKDAEGVAHIIDTDVVIELIQNAPEAEKFNIADMLRKIDFVNGPVVPFLKHLAQCFVNTQAGVL